MSENKKNRWFGSIVIVILIVIIVLIGKCVGHKIITDDSNPVEIIERCDPVYAQSKNEVDTASIIRYCVDNNLYTDLFPIKKMVKTVVDTLYLVPQDELLVFSDEKEDDDVNNCSQQNDTLIVPYPVTGVPEIIFINKPDKKRAFFGVGVTTFPSMSMEFGMMFGEWGISAGINKYFYHGTIDPAKVPEDINLVVRTKSVGDSNIHEYGVVEVPNFSVGVKVIKKF